MSFGNRFVYRFMFVSSLLLSSIVAYGTTPYVAHDYIRIPVGQLTPEFVSRYGFIRDHVVDSEYAFGYVTQSEFAKLPRTILNEVKRLDARQWAHHSMDPKTLQPRPVLLPQILHDTEDYHTYETLTTELTTLSTKYKNLSTLVSAGKSVEGRDLWYMRITSSKLSDQMKPKLLYISSMHGDEVVGKELLIYLIRDLLNLYGTDTDLTALVDNSILYIMPSMNPDGTYHQDRFNANGVDLNRDFPTMDDQPFSSGHAPETQAIMNLHQANNFEIAINFHTGALCFNTPWDSIPNDGTHPFGDDKLVQALANEYAELNAPMHAVNEGNFVNGVTYGYEWYQVLGGMQDWASFFIEATHSTVELSDVKWPDASTLAGFWTDNRTSLITFLSRGLDGIHLKVTDAQGNLLDSGVDMTTATRTLHYHGYVHRPAIQGTQQVTISAPGFTSQSLTLTTRRFDGTFQNVVLTKGH